MSLGQAENRARPEPWREEPATAALVFADGTVIEGRGIGATGAAVGEVCFNTAMTGYQEILTDPSYAGQIITFTFPHIGNVGTNQEDGETSNLAARSGVRGCVVRADVTAPSNYRAAEHLDTWLKARGIVGIAGIDTRALTVLIREKGYVNAVIAHAPDGVFDLDKLKTEAASWPGLIGLDLVPDVTTGQSYTWDEMRWVWGKGYAPQAEAPFHVVAVDYGLKRNILRCLATAGCRVTVVPATASARTFWSASRTVCSCRTGPVTRRRQGLCGARNQEDHRKRATGLRDMPWPPDARIGDRRAHEQDASGAPWG